MKVSSGGAQPKRVEGHIQLCAICLVEKLVTLNHERRQSVYVPSDANNEAHLNDDWINTGGSKGGGGEQCRCRKRR